MKTVQTTLLATLVMASTPAHAGNIPDSIAAAGETHVVTVHAQGAQVYECKADASGKVAWSFREPVATLIVDGKTVGRHYAGPRWEWSDGSTIAAKVSGRAPAATAGDIPLLKLDVSERRGAGMLDGITTIQRINTKGGTVEGTCPVAGALVSIPYAADYAFYRKTRAAQRND